MDRLRNRGSIIFQVAIMFAVCILLTGGITFISQLFRSGQNISDDMEIRSEEITDEVMRSVREYPAYEWLLAYWYEHAEELDIEYDAGFGGGTATEQKCQLLEKHAPDLRLKYADESAVRSLSEEDQKLYAEIIYSWLISRMDQIKESYKIDYLFCIQTNEVYENQFFLFSAASPGEIRGTEYEQIYTLGVTAELSEDQREAMKGAETDSSHFTIVGGYVDYYAFFDKINGNSLFVGITFPVKGVVSAVRTDTAKNSLAAMGYQIILAVICSLGILFLVLKPLKKIQKSIRLYKQNKDSSAVAADLEKIRMKNEIGELSGDVIELTREIDNYIEKIQSITAEKERLDTELSLAEQIQSSMLPQTFPPFPDRSEFGIYASMDPAREVGGDFYDFFLIDDDHLCLVIADVSGKGIPAALFMMMSMIIIKNCAMMDMSPSEVLETANEALITNNKAEMFITVWIGILEISTGKMTAANAGHEYPAIRKPDGCYDILKDKHGFVVAAMEGMKYKDYELQLEPGTGIFVYTDGLPEAADKDDNLFGTERMLAALNSEPGAGPERVLANVQKHVDEFVKDAEQFDDLTMLCIEYKG